MQKQLDNDIVKYNVSKNIRFLLNYNNKSRKEVCRDLDIKYTTFCDWVNGKTIPGYNNLEILGKYFQVEAWGFYGDIEQARKEQSNNAYASGLMGGKVLDMELLNTLSDEQIRTLLNSGFTFRHRTLEDYIEMAGGKLQVSGEYDWGEPVGSEIW